MNWQLAAPLSIPQNRANRFCNKYDMCGRDKTYGFTRLLQSMSQPHVWHETQMPTALRAEPRAQHLNWTRHVYRELNEEANDLATRGKLMDNIDCHIEIQEPQFQYIKFWRGAWDGGYDPGKVTCGIGFVLQGCRARPVHNQQWTNVVVGYVKCLGGSAMESEINAAWCLITMADRLFQNHPNPWAPLPPWQDADF